MQKRPHEITWVIISVIVIFIIIVMSYIAGYNDSKNICCNDKIDVINEYIDSKCNAFEKMQMTEELNLTWVIKDE